MFISETDLVIISQLVKDEVERDIGHQYYKNQLKVLEVKLVKEITLKGLEDEV